MIADCDANVKQGSPVSSTTGCWAVVLDRRRVSYYINGLLTLLLCLLFPVMTTTLGLSKSNLSTFIFSATATINFSLTGNITSQWWDYDDNDDDDDLFSSRRLGYQEQWSVKFRESGPP